MGSRSLTAFPLGNLTHFWSPKLSHNDNFYVKTQTDHCK
ncbi:hypothetical protein COO91_06614 [Nostoc flagelliforme CCNUN1]|uniref:Uncharacterized protein n=1 Tax=Nostoc flagelliforme CCNUN1 TaxID=2038116 RepID=A0A2K8SYS2_9NOSO|nr:hypothetical protein COO91_06614 [Nostoc flagelliforme CCNUN1]